MAAAFKSPFFILGFARGPAAAGFKSAQPFMRLSNAGLVVTPDGNRSVLDFWIGGVGENLTATGGWWHKEFIRNKKH